MKFDELIYSFKRKSQFLVVALRAVAEKLGQFASTIKMLPFECFTTIKTVKGQFGSQVSCS